MAWLPTPERSRPRTSLFATITLSPCTSIILCQHERQSQVVTMRFFGGFTVEEVAAQLGVSVSTVESDFRIARAWLRQRLRSP